MLLSASIPFDAKLLVFASCHGRFWHHRHEHMSAFETASCPPNVRKWALEDIRRLASRNVRVWWLAAVPLWPVNGGLLSRSHTPYGTLRAGGLIAVLLAAVPIRRSRSKCG